MPKYQSPVPLRTLCLENVARHLDKIWCADYRDNYLGKNQNGRRFIFIEGPFNLLTQDCIKDLTELLVSRRFMKGIYLHLLIVPHLKEVDFSGCPNMVTNDIVDLVCMRCRGLVKVNLEQCNRVSPTALMGLIQAFHDTLEAVFLSGTKLTNGVLETIGQTCTNILILSIDMCKVTRKAVESLFYSGSEKALTMTANNLRTIRMMGCSFQGDVNFIADILLKCPLLKCVTHFSLWLSIAKICERNLPLPSLNLTGIRQDMSLNLFEFKHKTHLISRIAECLPNIEHLSVHDVDSMDMELFHLLTRCGKKLKSLKLDWAYPYDFLRFIGVLYPDLDSLTVTISHVTPDDFSISNVKEAFENYISVNDMYSRTKNPWRKLQRFCLFYDHQHFTLQSSHVLLEIFNGAASSLSHLDFCWMPDPDADHMFLRALELKYFENLEVLRMRHSPTFTIQPVWQLIITAPMLRSITFSGCQKIKLTEYCEVKQFVKEKNLAIEVEEEFY